MLPIYIVLIGLISAQQYTKYTINDPQAQCLDGTPTQIKIIYFFFIGTQSAYYYYPGNGSLVEDLIVYFYGGGFCLQQSNESQTSLIDSCEERKLGFYGSTSNFPNLLDGAQGIMSNSNDTNSFMYNAAKIWIMYCDGSLYHNQMKGNALQEILQTTKSNAKNVLLVGSDVGGLFIVEQGKRILGIVRSAYPDVIIKVLVENVLWFTGIHSTATQHFMEMFQEVSGRIGKETSQLNAWDLIHQMDVSVFIVQPQYDWWQLNYINSITCHKNLHLEQCNEVEQESINQIRKLYLHQVLNLLKQHPQWGLWSLGCFWQQSLVWDESYSEMRDLINKINLEMALKSWFLDSEDPHVHYDVDQWPSNESCSHETRPVSQESPNNHPNNDPNNDRNNDL